MNQGDEFLLVETLPPQEYRREHLPGAIDLPPDQIKALAPKLLPNKNAEIIVYCASATCHASEKAARELAALGYTRVLDYAEGKQDWIEAGLPTESSQQHRTQRSGR